MRLTVNNIMFVKKIVYGDRPTRYIIVLKNRSVGSVRIYNTWNVEQLPKSVQKFLLIKDSKLWQHDKLLKAVAYIYE